jgi:serine O-acetyltransferase
MASPTFDTSLDRAALSGYLERLIDHYIPDGRALPYSLEPHVAEGLARLELCFAGIHRKYYTLDGRGGFDHLNGDHLAAFLYLVANSAWKATGDIEAPTKLFGLNKAMHGLDLYFSVSLPEVFLLVHPVGTVIGNATYGNYFAIYQNCTTGADGGIYPTFGEGTIMYSRTSVLGNSTIGDDVVFAANSFVVNADVPSNSLVVGQFPQHRILANTVPVRDRLFESAPKGG